MEFQLDNDWDTKRRGYVTVTDGPIVKSMHGVAMQVTQISLTYEPLGYVWEIYAVTLVGCRVNVLGKPGSRRDKYLYTNLDGAPDWLRRVVEHYRPKGEAPDDPVPFCITREEN